MYRRKRSVRDNWHGVRLSYTNTLIHRMVAGGWIQGGDIVDGSGSEGESTYGATFDGQLIS